MKKNLLLTIFLLFSLFMFSQTNKEWKEVSKSEDIEVSKNVQRISFPQDFKLFQLNLESFRQTLFTAPERMSSKASGIIISLPNVQGNMERFEVFEASNFDSELQAQFPEIRAYVGVGLDDRNAQVRLSSAPNGIQTMIFRTDKSNEFMEPYSLDGKTYAVFNSSRQKGRLGFTCYTDDQPLIQSAEDRAAALNMMRSNTGQLKTMRLALSCTGEYANYFGATSGLQSALVLAAFNATMTRVNGVFEKDFAIHLDLIANETAIIYYNAATDPYSPAANMGNWNAELQANLTSTITENAYDIGHLFGATGGGGNAGCIGCVCVNGSKGSGITSPADAIPAGDNFDIDYVAHEMGHQLGGNHTFSMSSENSSVNVEPGSGSTIMGYAGITGATDVQPHSDDYFVYASILQIQTNMASKTCPVTTTITHGTPVMDAGPDYTIPYSTPFKLTGSGTDSGGDVLSYCWEENDDATTVGAAASYPSPTKTNGPNFRSFSPVSVPYRYFPKLETVLTGTPASTWEVLPSVARNLNFVLTGRDNVAGGGQTGTDGMMVTISGTVGPFDVTSQSTDGISWTQGTSQTITWTVNNSTTLVGSANVDILLSTDGGLTFPTVLASNTPNDGSEVITVPNVAAVFCRVMVKPTGNIYYDINQKDFAIGYTITNTCNTYSASPALAIPDGSGTNGPIPGPVVSSTLSVPVVSTISDVNVNVNVTHTYINDLDIAVNHPDATQVLLWSGFCGSQDNFNITFSDGNPTPTCSGANTTGTFAPAGSLATLNGKPSNGTWTIFGRDNWAGDTGTINSWSVEVCSQTITASTENFGLSNFSLFPNPNNGSFTVKFDSETSNDVKIMIYDIRGREVFSKSYNNSGLFNETVNLNNIQSGVYLVNIENGLQKEVEKIVIE
jgi:subtilisin-like proprotein convertase family protein